MADPLFLLMVLSFAAGVVCGWVWCNVSWHQHDGVAIPLNEQPKEGRDAS